MKHNSNTRNMVDGKKFKIASLAVALSAALITTTTATTIDYDGNKTDSEQFLSDRPDWLGAVNMPSFGDKKVIYSGSDNPTFTTSSNNIFNIENVDNKNVSAIFGGAARWIEGDDAGVIVENNIVTIDKVDHFSVIGGYADKDKIGASGAQKNTASIVIARNNTVHIIGDVIGGNTADQSRGDTIIYGGYVKGEFQEYEKTYASDENNVYIEGNVENASVIGGTGFAAQRANKNKVEIGGDFTGVGELVGGKVVYTTSLYAGNFPAKVEASGNILKVNGNVTLDHKYGYIYGGHARDQEHDKQNIVEASDNEVMIMGDLKGNVAGGRAETSNSHKNSIVTASRNKITLGGDIQGKVSGGMINKPQRGDLRRSKAINNIVNITANKAIGSKEDTRVYGASYASFDSDDYSSEDLSDLFTGNILNFSGYTLKAQTIANFEHYNFTLDPRLANSKEASIDAEEIRLGNGKLKGTSKISVVDIKKGNLLYVNDRFVLMDSDKAFEEGSAEIATESTVAQQGISILYEIETIIDYENGKVTAVVKKGAGANPQLKSLSEGHLASLMQLTRAADMVAYEALDTIKAKNNGGLSTFFKFGGGHSRYDSGSHIKANDYHIMAGVSLRDEALTAAAFVEGGWGNYDTHNSFQGLGLRDVNGDGKNRYIGVGVIGQYDFAEGLYVDGSFRIGSSHNKFNAVGLRNETETARYSFSRTYVSAHAGLGYLYDLDDKNAIDFSAKYLWTHIGGKTLSVAGEKIKFNSLDSNRIRLSATWNHQYSDSTKFKAGAGYEYEFSAKAKGTVLDIYSIDAPKVKGGTGILTLGMNINPEANKNVDIDFNINGYAGKRDGVSASIKVGYNF